MNLTAAIQEALLAIICYDGTVGGARVAASLVPAKTYDPYYRELAEAAIAFLDQHGKAPGEHTLDLVDAVKARSPDDAEVYDRIHASMDEVYHSPSFNREYVMDRARMFARHQTLKRSIAEAIDALEEGGEDGVARAEAALVRVPKSAHDLFDAGVDFFGNPSRTLAFLDREEQSFPTGIPEFDRVGIGPKRGRMHCFAARIGEGKSWYIQDGLLKNGIVAGYRCLGITLEMPEDDYCPRLLQSFFSISKRKADVAYKTFREEGGEIAGFEDVLLKGRPHFQRRDIRKFLGRKLHKHRRRKLIIKSFPSGKLSVSELEAYLDYLEATQGFIPDLLTVDYPDLMRMDSRQEFRVSLGRTYIDLRGIAGDRNMALGVVTQLNREAKKQRVAGTGQVKDDDSKGAHTDELITYNQTQEEFELGLARLFVSKARLEADKFVVLVSQAYEVGQFRMDSTRMRGATADYMASLSPPEEDDE